MNKHFPFIFIFFLTAFSTILSQELPAWLEGTWMQLQPRPALYEEWEFNECGEYTGSAWTAAGEGKKISEYLKIVKMGDTFYYLAKPEENEIPVAFELVRWEEYYMVFENGAHDYPQRIIYKLESQQKLTATISKLDGSRKLTFSFTRVD